MALFKTHSFPFTNMGELKPGRIIGQLYTNSSKNHKKKAYLNYRFMPFRSFSAQVYRKRG